MMLSEWIQLSGAPIKSLVGDSPISGIQSDSRKVKQGDLFVSMPSHRGDAAEYISKAIAAGAAAVLVAGDSAPKAGYSANVAVAETGPGFLELSEAAWRLAHAILDYPSRAMTVIGVTGTNGKTTTAWIIRQLLEQLLGPCDYLGTLGFECEDGLVEVGNTTPFAVDLAQFLAKSRDTGRKGFSMEVSSHALAEKRSDGVEFDATVFTNLTQDHLDFHGSMTDYELAKSRLFFELPSQTKKSCTAAINKDDPVGEKWLRKLPSAIPYSVSNSSSGGVYGRPNFVRADRIAMDFTYGGSSVEAEFLLGGNFNVQNALAAVAGLVAAGFEFKQVVEALSAVRPVPGRFESVPTGKTFSAIVDYAHTPDALQKLLSSVRNLQPRRIITVFGCGGDRDRTKRPKMAYAATSLSDITIITSDNPRTEDPKAILNEVETGVNAGSRYLKIVDRAEAVKKAIMLAEERDIVVVAGKGHENYQIIGHVKHPMDDRALIKEALDHVGGSE